MNPILLTIICLFLPFLLQYAEVKYQWFAAIGSVVWAYGIGIIIGNLPWNSPVEPWVMPMISLSVPLSIPLMLFHADFKPWLKQSRTSVLSFILACLSVICTATLTPFLFPKTPILAEIVAMLTGTFIGGSPNLNAIGLSTNAKPETIALANGLDVFWSGILLFLFTTGLIPIIRKILPQPIINPEPFLSEDALSQKFSIIEALKPIALSVCILILSVLLSHLFFQTEQIIFIFFFVTLAGTVASFFTPVRQLKHAESVGNYLILVFCVSIASLIHIQSFMNQSLDYFWLGAWMVYTAFFLQLLLAKLFKIDSETFIITCIATIYSPAFVGMIAKRMNNKSVVLNGYTAGVAGFAIATYIGLLIFEYLAKN